MSLLKVQHAQSFQRCCDARPALVTDSRVYACRTDLAIEPARSHEGRVQNVGAVRGGDDDDAGVALEAIHLRQQLVQRLLALVVTAAHAGSARPADGVDLIDEHDARRVLLRLQSTGCMLVSPPQPSVTGGMPEQLDAIRYNDDV